MRTTDLLCFRYSEWLKHNHARGQDNILRSFRTRTQKFYNSISESDNKSIYLPIHAAFLIHTLTTQQIHTQPFFPLGILLLNSILKEKPKLRISLTSALIQALKNYFRAGRIEQYSGELAGNAVWLLCKCLQGSWDRRAALMRVWESGVVVDFLEAGSLNPQAEKGISMLLYFSAKNLQNKLPIVNLLLKNAHKFTQTEAIKQVLNTLREAGTNIYSANSELQNCLASFMVSIMAIEDITLSEKMQSIHLIAAAASANPRLLTSLRVPEIIQNKLIINELHNEPMLPHLMQLVELTACKKTAAIRLLELSMSTLHKNVFSRRVFIMLYQRLSLQQLITLLGGVHHELQRLVSSESQREDGLKILICLKHLVNKMSIRRIFWCACRRVVKMAITHKSESMPQSTADLYQLLQDVISNQLQIIYDI